MSCQSNTRELLATRWLTKSIIIWQSVTVSLLMKIMNCTSNHTVTHRCQNVVCFDEWRLWFSMCAPVVCSQFVYSIEFKIVQSDCGTNLGSTWSPRLISGFFSKSFGFAQLKIGLSNSPHQAHPPGMNVYKQNHVVLKILGFLQRKLKSSQSCTQTDFELLPLPFIAAAGV